ncbi:MAG: hypothetical protein Q9157_000521 [Trypethelium eluteriae]
METPIPAFYCCYLLRSTVRRNSLYVGSTPNPPRRVKQHNGSAPGGFPSKIAALQFEWAWQKTHLTRHLPEAEREKRAPAKFKRKPPPRSLSVILSDLHLLLRVKSFERWPLGLRFFADDVYKAWQVLEERVSVPIRDGISINFTPSKPTRTDHGISLGPDQVQGVGSLDLGYSSMKPLLEKTLVTLATNTVKHNCTKCKEEIQLPKALALVCPRDTCQGVWHLSCLSQELLAPDGSQNSLIPTKGSCPSCNVEMEWSMLMKDLTLRNRGQKEIMRLFKWKSSKKADTQSNENAAIKAVLESMNVPEEDIDVGDEEDDDQPTAEFKIPPGLAADLEDDWAFRADDDEDGVSSIASDLLARQSPRKQKTEEITSQPIVEDSDWGGAEILE